jgi:hypothetical protein
VKAVVRHYHCIWHNGLAHISAKLPCTILLIHCGNLQHPQWNPPKSRGSMHPSIEQRCKQQDHAQRSLTRLSNGCKPLTTYVCHSSHACFKDIEQQLEPYILRGASRQTASSPSCLVYAISCKPLQVMSPIPCPVTHWGRLSEKEYCTTFLSLCGQHRPHLVM